MDPNINDVVGMTLTDYIVFILLLAASLLIGAYYGIFKRQKTTSDYLVGDRNMPVIPTTISLLASFVSAILILGIPSEFIYHGSLLWESMYGYIIAFPLAAYIFVPTFYKLKLTSVYEYLELRFESRLVRLLTSVTFFLQSLLYLAVVIYAPSIALHTVAGFPQWASILCIGGIGTFYTAVGGLKAVVWTDVLQCLLMFGGLLAIIIAGSIEIGGIVEAFKISIEGGRFQYLDFNPSPFVRHTTIVCVIGHGVTAIATYGCQQTSVQRYCSMSNLKGAVWTLLLNAPLLVVIVSLGWIAGVVIYANYANCDPLLAGNISTKDAIVPYFVLHKFLNMPGMLGLFIASLLSGALSSVSSLLNALAAVAWEDFISKVKYFNNRTESTKLIITKLIGFLFGFMSIALAFVVGNLSGLVQTTFTLNGAVSGPLLGVFLLALFVPWANKYGAASGIICGHAIAIYIGFGAITYGVNKPAFLPRSVSECSNNTLYSNTTIFSTIQEQTQDLGYPEKLFTISYLYYCLIGCIVTVVIGTVVSTVTVKLSKHKVNEEYLHPLIRKMMSSSKKVSKTSKYNVSHFNAGYVHDEPKYKSRSDSAL